MPNFLVMDVIEKMVGLVFSAQNMSKTFSPLETKNIILNI